VRVPTFRAFAYAGAALALLCLAVGCGGSVAPGTASTISFSCLPTDFDCAQQYVTNVTKADGPAAALRAVSDLQREGKIARAVDDHQLAHAIGRETAKHFGVNPAAFRRCPNVFNYGCVHGFFEYALGRAATPRAAAVSICESGGKRSEVDRFSCYHGVGHGVMMAKAYDLQGALGVCDTFPTAQAEQGCWQGVFMENVNAGMAGKARPGVFVRSRPLAPCTGVAEQYRHECYINQAGWIVLVSSFDLRRAARICGQAPSPWSSVCAQSLGLMVTNPSWQESLAKPLVGKSSFEQIAWNLCRRFPTELRKDCVVAAVDNLANFDQLDVDRSDRFCLLVAASLRAACYKQIGLNLHRRTTSAADAEGRCDSVTQAFVADCVAGTQGQVESAASPPRRVKPTASKAKTKTKTASVTVGAIVVMDDGGFYPKRVTIKKGQAVNFVNRSQDDWWPASDPHPIHTDYPGFDAGTVIRPGDSWTFRFDRRGTWGYHNHLSPTTKGTVVVK
jgi:plastocyanin